MSWKLKKKLEKQLELLSEQSKECSPRFPEFTHSIVEVHRELLLADTIAIIILFLFVKFVKSFMVHRK